MEDEDYFNLTFIIIGIVSLVTNSALIAAIKRTKQLQTIKNIIILNLCVANLFFILQIILYFVWIETGKWPLGMFGCVLDNTAYGINMIASSVFITILSIDMIINSKWKIRFRQMDSRYVPVVVSAGSWLLSVVFISPYIVSSNVNGKDDYCDILWDGYAVYTFLMGFVVPLSLIMGLFVMYIIGKVRSNFSDFDDISRKSNTLSLFIIGSYFLCKLPLFILDIVEDIPSYVNYVVVWNMPLRTDFACYVVFYSHVAVIPIICLLYDKEYLASLRKRSSTPRQLVTEDSSKV